MIMGRHCAMSRSGSSNFLEPPPPIEGYLLENAFDDFLVTWGPTRAGADPIFIKIWRVTGLGAPALILESADIFLDDAEWITGQPIPEFASYRAELWIEGSSHVYTPYLVHAPP